MKKQLIIIIFFLGVSLTYGQQEPQYTHYMYNMSIVNPGYTTADSDLIQIGSLYRSQWVGIEGAPKTANLFLNIPISKKLEVSVNYWNDRIGSEAQITQNLFNIDLAYKAQLTKEIGLSIGVKAGLDNLSTRFTEVFSDPLLQPGNKNNIVFGAGAFLSHKDFYGGFSIPNIVPSKVDFSDDISYQKSIHSYFIAGYVYQLNDYIKLKPSTVFKFTKGAPVSFDVSGNALFYDKFEAGVSYRFQDAVTGLVGMRFLQNLQLGFAYDYNISELNDFNDGSFEFFLLYEFDLAGLRKKYKSPRFY